MITFGRSLEDAIEWPRLHHQLDPMYVEVEGENFISVDFFYELQILLEKLKNSWNEVEKVELITAVVLERSLSTKVTFYTPYT